MARFIEPPKREKRTFKRISCSMVGYFDWAEGTSGGCVCRDISVRGAGINTPIPLSRDAHLQLKLTSRNGNPLRVEGEVAWCKSDNEIWRAGIEFIKPQFLPIETVI